MRRSARPQCSDAIHPLGTALSEFQQDDARNGRRTLCSFLRKRQTGRYNLGIRTRQSSQFDAEDLRLLERTSRFASAACQVLASIENLKLENAAREKAETAVRELANGLETQVRVRTQELERSTRELAEANEDLQFQVGLLQHIPVAAWTLRPDGTPDFVNRNWLEYSGQALDYVQSNPEAWMTAIHPEDREAASKSICDGIRSGQDFTMEARFRRVQDGAYRWHLNRAAALRDAEGNLLRFVRTSTDIEDQKQSQEN